MILLSLMCFAGAVQASAATENVVAAAEKAAEGKWVRNSRGIRYKYTKSGKYAEDRWLNIRGGIYHFDAKGYCETGWIKWQGHRYYAASSGKLYVNKWMRKNGKSYFLRSNGILAKNRLIKWNGRYYYVDGSGVQVQSAWVTLDGSRSYFGADGARVQSTWLRYKGKFYYLDAAGEKVVNHWVGDYYVGEDGSRKTNCVVGGYYLDASGKKTVRKFDGDYIFVGDSRIVGMKLAIAPSDTLYIAKESMGYSWLKSAGGPELEKYLAMVPDVKVVMALGVNDLGSISQYIAYYRGLIAKYPRTHFYLLSVNPVNEGIASAHGYTIRNSQITAFNKKLKAEFAGAYLDTYSHLKKKGFASSDGLHYTAAVYRNLYNYIIKKIK